MTEQHIEDPNTQEEQLNNINVEPVLSIAFDGHSVHLLTANGLPYWQALGLIRAAEALLLSHYNSKKETV